MSFCNNWVDMCNFECYDKYRINMVRIKPGPQTSYEEGGEETDLQRVGVNSLLAGVYILLKRERGRAS